MMTKRKNSLPAAYSTLESLFALQLRASGIEADWLQQHKAIPHRQFRYDFACPRLRVLVEIQGGNYQRGAHARPFGLKRDYEKANLAQRHGWIIYQFDGDAVNDGSAIEWILEEYKR